MSEQMLKIKLQHLTNMGKWETGKHVQYVQRVADCEYKGLQIVNMSLDLLAFN
jgi:hypothetical protein